MISPLLSIELNQYLDHDLRKQRERSQLRELANEHRENVLARLTRELVWRWKLGHYTYRECDQPETVAM